MSLASGYQYVIRILVRDYTPLSRLDQYNPDRHQMDKEEILVGITESNQIRFHRSITRLSSWVFNLAEIGAVDILLYEETFYCSTYNLTLLRMIE